MNRPSVWYALFASTLLVGCPSEPQPETGTETGTETDTEQPLQLEPGVNELVLEQDVEGETVERSYLLHLPSDYDGTGATPLLFAFHGSGGEGQGFVAKFTPPVENREFIGVYPNGIANSWNIGREESKADDVAFVTSILSGLEGVPGIDTSKPVGLGSSNGAALVHKIAMESDLFVAIVPQVSQLLVDSAPEASAAPVSVMQFNGTEDDSCPYDGGIGVLGYDFRPAEESAAVWAAHNGCDETPVETAVDPHVKMEWPNCDAGRRVVHYRLNGVGHSVPPDVDGGTNPRIIEFLLEARQ